MTAQRLDARVAHDRQCSRTAAALLIRAGAVLLGDQVLRKPAQRIEAASMLQYLEHDRYVSRGGDKLAHALERFGCNPRDLSVLDIGISTGGFADCLLQAGAARVIGVDVGHHQLAASLRSDPRIDVYEGVNARELSARLPQLGRHVFALVTVDVSFISLRYVFAEIAGMLAPGGSCIALVKPQFEVGRDRLGRGGIVRDPVLHEEVLLSIRTSAQQHGLAVRDQCESPILGNHGNREFLLQLVPQELGS